MRATLRLTLRCDNRCLFCAQRGLPPDEPQSPKPKVPEPQLRQPQSPEPQSPEPQSPEPQLPDGPARGLDAQLRALRARASELTFVGGEPGLDERLPQAIAAARALGFSAVGVQTNGAQLAEHARALAAAGLTDVHVSLHGASAAEHDYHTGSDGSFQRLLAGVAAARAASLRVVATTVVTRSNFRTLGALPALLHARGVSAWSLALVRTAGAAAEAFDRLVPRLGLSLPFVLHALSAARALGLPAFIDGAPLCLLGPFAAHALAPPPSASPAASPSSFTYAGVCEACPSRAACPGVDAAYLARFGADELHPVVAPARVPDDRASLFVGTGELHAAAPPQTWSPPSEVRRSLPLYGKVQPAAREASSATPRRSGEALRELFPDLFEKDAPR